MNGLLWPTFLNPGEQFSMTFFISNLQLYHLRFFLQTNETNMASIKQGQNILSPLVLIGR